MTIESGANNDGAHPCVIFATHLSVRQVCGFLDPVIMCSLHRLGFALLFLNGDCMSQVAAHPLESSPSSSSPFASCSGELSQVKRVRKIGREWRSLTDFTTQIGDTISSGSSVINVGGDEGWVRRITMR